MSEAFVFVIVGGGLVLLDLWLEARAHDRRHQARKRNERRPWRRLQ